MATKKTVSGIMQELNKLVEDVDGKALGPTLDKLEGILGGLTTDYQAESISTITQECDKLRTPGVTMEEVQKFLEMLEGIQNELAADGRNEVAEEIGKLGGEIQAAAGVDNAGGTSSEAPAPGEATESVSEEEDEDEEESDDGEEDIEGEHSAGPATGNDGGKEGPGKSQNSTPQSSPLTGKTSGGASVTAKGSATGAGSSEKGKAGIPGVSTTYDKATPGKHIDVVQKFGDTKGPEASLKMPKMSEAREARLKKLQRYL